MDDRTPDAQVRRPDESMEIINDLFNNPLDPGYAVAAERREAEGAQPARLPVGLFVGLGLLGVLLTTAALQVPEDADLVSAERTVVIEQITDESAATAALEQDISALQEEIAQVQDRLLAGELVGEDLSETLLERQGELGLGTVRGPGLVVEMRDAEPGADGHLDDLERVLDKDLAMVVNGLWAAGAEAISINDERLTPQTAIRRIEGVILVNLRPVVPPYEVRAIGDPRTLSARFGNGPGLAWLGTAKSQGGIQYTIVEAGSLTLPVGNAPLDYVEVKENS